MSLIQNYEYIRDWVNNRFLQELQSYYNKSYIDTAIQDLIQRITNAIAGVTQFDYVICESTHPTTGKKGTIYLVPTGDVENVYDEYLYIDDKWEKLGPQLDLSSKQDVISDLDTIRSGALAGATAYQKPSAGIPTSDMTDTVQQAISFAESTEKRSYNSSNPDGMGYLVLKKNKTFAEQVTEENTIYEIRDEFNLGGNTFNMPSECILKFNGGKISNGTLNGSNTKVDARLDFVFSANLSGTWDVETYFPEWFGAVGDGTTDDTTAFSKLDGKHVTLSNKTYLISNATFGSKTCIFGAGRGASVLKQKNGSTGDFITLLNWNRGILKDLTIEGGTEIIERNFQQALVKMKTTNASTSSYRSIIDNVSIINSMYNGLSILGKGEVDDGVTCDYNWVFTISNLYVGYSKRACIYNRSSDNQFSNINASGGQLAGIIERGSSNNWTNLKVDGSSCYLCDRTNLQALLENTMQGAAVIIEANLVSFVNLDIQSSCVCGLKIVYGQRLHISGNINNCALYIDRTQKALSPALYVANSLTDSQLDLKFLADGTQYKQFSRGQSSIVSRNIFNFMFQPNYDGNRSYEYELMLCKKENIVNDTTLLTSSPQIKQVKNLLPDNTETSSIFYKNGGTIDYSGAIFGGETPSYHLPDAASTNGYELLASPASRGLRPGDIMMTMMVIKPVSLPQNPTLPYFNVIGVGSSLQYIRQDNVQISDVVVGGKYLVAVIFNVPSSGNFNIRCYRVANSGEYYISNIKQYNLTEDIGFYLPTIFNYRSTYHIMDVLFASNNLAELTEEFGDIPVEMSLLGNAVLNPSVESRIGTMEQEIPSLESRIEALEQASQTQTP